MSFVNEGNPSRPRLVMVYEPRRSTEVATGIATFPSLHAVGARLILNIEQFV